MWGSIFAIQCAFAVMVILAYSTAQTWKKQNPAEHTSQEIRGIQFLSAICLGVAVLWFVLMCIWRSAINLAVKTISLTAECIQAMPTIILTPLVQTIGVVCFLVRCYAMFCMFVFHYFSDGLLLMMCCYVVVVVVVGSMGYLLLFHSIKWSICYRAIFISWTNYDI